MSTRRVRRTARLAPPLLLAAALGAFSLAPAAGAAPVAAHAAAPAAVPAPKQPVATGTGGAVASVSAEATDIGIEVLRHGGNAVDAAVATAAALGVTEPYSSGIGGGGYFVYYDARSHRVSTLDGRETAPGTADQNLFVENGQPLDFWTAVDSGRSVGVPGSLLTWQQALDRWGTRSLAQSLRPAERLADKGFVVDQTFHDQTAQNQTRFSYFPATAALFLPGGQPPAVGSVFRNPDLAATYRELERDGVDALYRGDIGRDITQVVQHPQVDPASGWYARSGAMTPADLAAYRVRAQAPTEVDYRGLDVYGIAPSSSGGTTMGEALNILNDFDLKHASSVQYLHDYLEASRIAFADRNRWVGDPRFEDVPTKALLSQRFADSRACLITPDSSLTSPLAPGDPLHPSSGCPNAGTPAPTTPEGTHTTHLTVADKWGDVVSYTLTIEQTGGSAMTVPGRGFLLNNELTDFDFTPAVAGVPDPNLPGPSKRPRSSMSPTIVLKNGRFDFAVGSPGGASIITTVLQVLTEHVDRGLSLEQAIAVPRISQRNLALTEAEPAFLGSADEAGLEAIGESFTLNPEIGAATGIQALPGGLLQAAAEPVRRGGGAAAVVRPVGPQN
ncbi:gamma-glutamyltransferase [Streptacidiphilus anmyonensis]|uniref:gamma-glutamyltransferase n=1 Tax=Streptacidiphilus anmyonensis TaxID=405782 RepID=UPI00069380DE|nr:gamma-glutamyltransferase [Streptacidiphilus anmyonensis]